MDILRVTNEGIDKPTQIMYKANLSWVALLGHLKDLIAGGFLREVEYGTRKKYEITQRGSELLESYQRVVTSVRDLPAAQVKF